MLDASFLFASLIWGTVGFGYFMYGKKSQEWPAMVGGAGMMIASYFCASALLMSVVCIGIGGGVYWLLREGH
jgi:hypothetical protein